MQHQLGVRSSADALDIDLACSGFIYGLGLAKALIISVQARYLLFVTANTLTKFIDPNDRDSVTILWRWGFCHSPACCNEMDSSIGPLVYCTNGRDGLEIVVLNSGTRTGDCATSKASCLSSEKCDRPRFIMNGRKVFDFVLDTVPKSVTALYSKLRCEKRTPICSSSIKPMLEELRRLLELPKDKFHITIGHCGNTGSSSIPIASSTAKPKVNCRAVRAWYL
jgi:3-oxoacyl-[acyl-carrier-protein] synthase-3